MLGPVLSTLYVITHLTQQKPYEIVIVIIPILQMRNWGTVFLRLQSQAVCHKSMKSGIFLS